MDDKSKVSFFVLGNLSLSHHILVPIRFSRMQCHCTFRYPLHTLFTQHKHIYFSSCEVAGTGASFTATAAPQAIVMAACQGVVVGCRRRLRMRLDALTKFEVTSLCHSTLIFHKFWISYSRFFQVDYRIAEHSRTVQLGRDWGRERGCGRTGAREHG